MPTTDLLRLLLDVSGRANDDDDDGDPLWWLRREVCLSLSLSILQYIIQQLFRLSSSSRI